MQKKNLFNKKLNKSLLSITKRIESFFNFFRENIFHKKNFSKSIKTMDKKIFLGAAAIFITVITYFLIPAFYDKNIIKKLLESQIFDQYNLEVKLDENLRYGLFPKPHFLSKNTRIEYNSNNIAASNNTKVFISINNFFSSSKIRVKNLFFYQTDFKIKNSNFNFFINLLNNRKSNKELNFLNSKFFYLDKNDDLIFLINLKSLNYLLQDSFLKKANSKLDIFNSPMSLEVDHNTLEKFFSIELKALPLRLNIKNNSNYTDQKLDGELNLTIINKDKKINYSLENNSLKFNTKDNKVTGDINVKPFFISSNLNLFQIDLKKIFKDDSIVVNILKSEVFNNYNLNGKINVNTANFRSINFLKEIKFVIRIVEGNIFLKNLTTTFRDSVVISLDDTQLIVDNNKLKFAGYITLDLIDVKGFYEHYQISKKIEKI